MKTQDDDMTMEMQSCNPLSKLTWLLVGIGIGAAAGLLLAPQSGEDTREWISVKYKDGIDTVNSKVRQTSEQVGDWIDQNKREVTRAVSAGKNAYSKAKAEAD
jgi:gas vesicle protein